MAHFAPETTSPSLQALPTLVLNGAIKKQAPTRRAKIRDRKITSVSKDVGFVDLSYTAGGSEHWYNNFRKLAVTTKV